MVEGDGGEAPDAVLPVTEHWECVTVAIPRAEVCVAPVLWAADVTHGQGEDLLHLKTHTEHTH